MNDPLYFYTPFFELLKKSTHRTLILHFNTPWKPYQGVQKWNIGLKWVNSISKNGVTKTAVFISLIIRNIRKKYQWWERFYHQKCFWKHQIILKNFKAPKAAACVIP